MTRYVWKEAVEDIHQTNYDPILAEILPSYRLPLVTQNAENTTTVVHRKVSKDDLRFPRFFFYAPVQKPGKDDMMLRTHHFRIRLFEHLPWLAFQKTKATEHETAASDGDYLFSLIPRTSYDVPDHIEQFVEVHTLSTHLLLEDHKWNQLKTIRLTSTCLDHAPGHHSFFHF